MNRVLNNRYEIIKKIGSGGMADVYLANDLVLSREVAIKTLRHDLSNNAVSLLRFKREANAGSGLHHENIVEVYDVGESNGTHYIVMEYVKGHTAKELLFRRGSLETEEATKFMMQLASGVAKAHSKGIIHRDIKPQNILVKADSTIKISDFGIAQAEDELQLTKTDAVMGSVHYLAPELLRGEGASNQSDIYAMGILFYELLTGKPPFEDDIHVNIAMKHLKDDLPDLKEYNSSIPNSIINIIKKATAKNTDNRYLSANEMLSDLATAFDENKINENIWNPIFEDDSRTKMIDTLTDVKETEKKKDNPNKKRNIILASLLGLTLVLLVGSLFFKKEKVYVLEDLQNMGVEEAKDYLKDYNIHISQRFEYEFSNDVDADKIIRTNPEKGTEIEFGTQIYLILSRGKAFEIIDYVGKNINDVRQEIEENSNISLSITYEYEKGKEPGTILKQEGIELGTLLSSDDRRQLSFVVAKDLDIQIPNLSNFTIKEAQNQLEGLGVKVELEKLSLEGLSKYEINSLSYGVVIRSNPSIGSTYVQTEDSFITLYYYDEADIPEDIPDVDNGLEEPEIPDDEDDETGD